MHVLFFFTPQRTLHKDRTGGDLFLFTHLTVEVSVFIYLFCLLCALGTSRALPTRDTGHDTRVEHRVRSVRLA